MTQKKNYIKICQEYPIRNTMSSGKDKQTAKSSKKNVVEEGQQEDKTVQSTVTKTERKQSRKTEATESKPKTETHVDASNTTANTTAESSEDSTCKFESQFALIQNEIKVMREGLQVLNTNLRKLESAYKHDIKKVRRHKQKRNGPHEPTGFAKPQTVPDKLAKFIGVKPGTELTGPAITSKVWAQMKERNLTFKDDKRVFRTNKEVRDLFGVPESVDKSTDHKDKNGFNFCNLQKYIAKALNNQN